MGVGRICIRVHVTGDSSSKNVIACIIVCHHYIYHGSTVYIPMHHRWESSNKRTQVMV